MTYSIPEMNMEALEKKLARISKKAAKYGCDFHFEKIGELRGADFEDPTEVFYNSFRELEALA